MKVGGLERERRLEVVDEGEGKEGRLSARAVIGSVHGGLVDLSPTLFPFKLRSSPGTSSFT